MAIDPDMQPIIDAINARLDTLEANGGNVDLTTVNARLDALEASAVDDAWIRYQKRLATAMENMTDEERIAYLDGQA